VELDQVVVRVAALAHLVRGRADAPVVPGDDVSLALDHRLEAREDVRPALLVGLRVEQEHEVVDGLLGRHRGGGW
jgi:hypothetical protein